MSSNESRVRQAFRTQAEWCETLGSPFTARLCHVLAERLDRSSAVGRAVLDWPNDPQAAKDALPLRLAAGLHALVLRRASEALIRVYPPRPVPSPEALWPVIAETLVAFEGHLLGWLERPPQTNEVARSGVLYAGLMHIARRTGLPLALYEVGASAGLNLNADRYRYRFGLEEAGDPSSPVLIAPQWQGHVPRGRPEVIAREGCDLSPLSVDDPADCERLLSYVWADQPERLKRLAQALAIARQAPVSLHRMDAASFVEEALPLEAPRGVVRVLMHSVAFQYFSQETKARIKAHMATAGLVATREAPLAWLSYELDPLMGGHALRLTLWPEGGEELLATAHPHGAHVMWMG